MSSGIVYIVKNPAFPHLIKIGQTSKSCVEDRGLNASNVAEDFVVLKSYKCDNIEEVEAHLHNLFKQFRHFTQTGRKTEFFYTACENEALRTLDILAKAQKGQDFTAELQEIVDEQQSEESEYDETMVRVRKKDSFEMLNLPIGAELIFLRDPTKICHVIQPLKNNRSKRIEYNGEIYSLSGLALKLLHECGYSWPRARGIDYFSYQDESLKDRLNRILQECPYNQ